MVSWSQMLSDSQCKKVESLDFMSFLQKVQLRLRLSSDLDDWVLVWLPLVQIFTSSAEDDNELDPSDLIRSPCTPRRWRRPCTGRASTCASPEDTGCPAQPR